MRIKSDLSNLFHCILSGRKVDQYLLFISRSIPNQEDNKYPLRNEETTIPVKAKDENRTATNFTHHEMFMCTCTQKKEIKVIYSSRIEDFRFLIWFPSPCRPSR